MVTDQQYEPCPDGMSSTARPGPHHENTRLSRGAGERSRGQKAFPMNPPAQNGVAGWFHLALAAFVLVISYLGEDSSRPKFRGG
jgi:hypothetical protein